MFENITTLVPVVHGMHHIGNVGSFSNMYILSPTQSGRLHQAILHFVQNITYNNKSGGTSEGRQVLL